MPTKTRKQARGAHCTANMHEPEPLTQRPSGPCHRIQRTFESNTRDVQLPWAPVSPSYRAHKIALPGPQQETATPTGFNLKLSVLLVGQCQCQCTQSLPVSTMYMPHDARLSLPVPTSVSYS